MTLEESKLKAQQVQFLINKNPYKPFDEKLVEIIIAPNNADALQGFLEAKFKHEIYNEELLRHSKQVDFNVYGIFENEFPYHIRTIKEIILNNNNWSEFNTLDPSQF